MVSGIAFLRFGSLFFLWVCFMMPMDVDFKVNLNISIFFHKRPNDDDKAPHPSIKSQGDFGRIPQKS